MLSASSRAEKANLSLLLENVVWLAMSTTTSAPAFTAPDHCPLLGANELALVDCPWAAPGNIL
jgi:hypothetical protein